MSRNATVVRNSPSVPSNSAEATTASDTPNSRVRRKKLRICVYIAAVVLVIADVTVPTVVILTRNKDDTVQSNTTITPSSSSTAFMVTEPTTMEIFSTPAPTTEQAVGDRIPLVSVDGIAHGVYSTYAGGNSHASKAGNYSGQYPPEEPPAHAVDDSLPTKYSNLGSCYMVSHVSCGLNSGFYLELQQNATVVAGLQVCTADNFPERDPTAVTLEGSNQSASALTLGASWMLIYRGEVGLNANVDRLNCGSVQVLDNVVPYKSFRFLVTRKRGLGPSVQYSEVYLYGY